MAGNSSEPGVGQAERIARLLGSFDAGHRRLTFTQVVARSGLPRATCHRMLAELTRQGFLETDETGRHAIGSLVWEWGQLAPVEQDLRRVATPYMQDLLAATRQIVNLFTLDHGRALLLERIAGSRVGAPVAAPGDRLPLLRSAAGKVMLVASTASVEEAWAAAAAEADAGASPEAVRAELERVRRQGWAATAEEHHAGTWGLAVPVPVPLGAAPAALGIVALAPIPDPQRVLPALTVTAAAIGRAVQRRSAQG